MGLRSRNKGARGERALVEYLRDKGYKALRVPLSGAMRGYKCDVIVEDNPDMTFELKCRANEYESIYHLYKTHKDENGTAWFSNGRSADPAFKMSDAVENVLNGAGTYPIVEGRAVSKLIHMRQLLNGANYLVIRGDRMGFLFIRYI